MSFAIASRLQLTGPSSTHPGLVPVSYSNPRRVAVDPPRSALYVTDDTHRYDSGQATDAVMHLIVAMCCCHAMHVRYSRAIGMAAESSV
jgi:hypothetical protein